MRDRPVFIDGCGGSFIVQDQQDHRSPDTGLCRKGGQTILHMRIEGETVRAMGNIGKQVPPVWHRFRRPRPGTGQVLGDQSHLPGRPSLQMKQFWELPGKDEISTRLVNSIRLERSIRGGRMSYTPHDSRWRNSSGVSVKESDWRSSFMC